MQTISETAKKVHQQRPHLLLGSQSFTEAVVEEYTKELSDNFKELELLLAAEEQNTKLLIDEIAKLKQDLKAAESVNEWISVEDRKPLCYKTGDWYGEMSDEFLAKDKHGKHYISTAFEGFIDGYKYYNFYDEKEYEIDNVVEWKPIN